MDANASYPLVSLPPQQGSLVPVSSTLLVDLHSKPDVLAWLWRRFCRLAVLFFIALALLRRLRMQVVLLRQQANYWRAQHQRAVQREADCKDQIHLLEGEIRELKRRLFGRKSETSSATQPKTNPKSPPTNTKPRTRGQQPGSKGLGLVVAREHRHAVSSQRATPGLGSGHVEACECRSFAA